MFFARGRRDGPLLENRKFQIVRPDDVRAGNWNGSVRRRASGEPGAARRATQTRGCCRRCTSPLKLIKFTFIATNSARRELAPSDAHNYQLVSLRWPRKLRGRAAGGSDEFALVGSGWVSALIVFVVGAGVGVGWASVWWAGRVRSVHREIS